MILKIFSGSKYGCYEGGWNGERKGVLDGNEEQKCLVNEPTVPL